VHVDLGCDQLPVGYTGQDDQENLVAQGPVPWTIVGPPSSTTAREGFPGRRSVRVLPAPRGLLQPVARRGCPVRGRRG